jgi:IS30 family transposase
VTGDGETSPVMKESTCLGVQVKVPGRLLVRLNMTVRPIANKYREGKLKSTLKRELKRT